MRRFLLRCPQIVTLTVCAVPMIGACSAQSKSADAPALKAIDQAALQSTVAATAKELKIPGAVVLLQTPQGKLEVNYGTTELGKSTPPSASTYFRIASNTKTMTSAIILQLAQENKLRLDDAISKYVSGVPDGDKITLAELLEMRSGLYNYTSAPEVAAKIDSDPTKVWMPPELLAIAFTHPANAPPDKEFEYCNTNYALLGLVIEKVDGKPLLVSMQDRLFTPLGLNDTLLPWPNSHSLPKPFSHGYLYGSSSVALVGEPPYSAELKANAKSGKLLPKDYTDVNHSFAAAAGGVVSTASDMAIWIHSLVAGKVLNAEYQRRWLDSLQPEDPKKPEGQRYGYGISQMRWGPNMVYFHGGETVGFNSFIGYDIANQITLVVWTNLPVSLDEMPTANALMLKVLDQIYTVSPLSSGPKVPAEK
jgi:CubicO group peptidase (beta-lactamase class C family)